MMVEITPLPGVPPVVPGVINVQGGIVPVLDLRRCFSLPERPPELSDQLIIVTCSGHAFALMADAAEGIRACREADLTEADRILPELPFLSGIAKFPDGLILIQNLESLISSADSEALIEAMKRVPQ